MTKPTTIKWKTEKVKSKKQDMLRTISKQSRESVESVLKEGCSGNDLQKKKVLSLE